MTATTTATTPPRTLHCVGDSTPSIPDCAKGRARDILGGSKEVLNSLTQVPHLGCLYPLKPAVVSRWSYVAKTLQILFDMKREHPGLGLGSPLLTGENAPDVTGLEAAQSWAILSNLGHLFGTFATERAILCLLEENRSFSKDFLQEMDESFRGPTRTIVMEHRLQRMFYALAAWRFRRLQDIPHREQTKQLVRHFLDESKSDVRWQRIRWAYRKARWLAYLSIHQDLDIEPPIAPPLLVECRKTLRPHPSIGFSARDEETPLQTLLQQLSDYTLDRFFTSPEAAALVLAHLRAFKLWWGRQGDAPFSLRLERLFNKPADWEELKPASLQHWARLRLPPSGSGWPSQVQAWRAGGKPWESGGSVLLSPRFEPSNDKDVLVCDLYLEGPQTPTLVHHVVCRLAQLNTTTWIRASERVSVNYWRDLTAFAVSLLQIVVKEGYEVRVDPIEVRGEGAGYIIFAPGAQEACGRLKHFIGRIPSEERVREREAMLELCLQEADAHPNAAVILFLGQVFIYDKQHPASTLQEIDAVWAWVDGGGVQWNFIEHKSGRTSGMMGQLKELNKYVRVEADFDSDGEVAIGDVVRARLRWPIVEQPKMTDTTTKPEPPAQEPE